jgi:hypothetical protein
VSDGVSVFVAVDVAVSDGVNVFVAVEVAVSDGVSVLVAVDVAVSEGVDVFVAVDVAVSDGVNVIVAVGVAVSDGVGVDVTVAVSVTAAAPTSRAIALTNVCVAVCRNGSMVRVRTNVVLVSDCVVGARTVADRCGDFAVCVDVPRRIAITTAVGCSVSVRVGVSRVGVDTTGIACCVAASGASVGCACTSTGHVKAGLLCAATPPHPKTTTLERQLDASRIDAS